MHLLRHKDKTTKPAPFISGITHWKIPGIRKMRGKRYDCHGNYIGPCGPRKPRPDPLVERAIKEAYAAAAKMPMPEEGGAFDLNRFRPLPGRILVTRGPMIKSEKGIDLPEDKWHHGPEYIVLKIGDGVRSCDVGDRVIVQKKHKPRAVRLGSAGFYITRDAVIVGILEAHSI